MTQIGKLSKALFRVLDGQPPMLARDIAVRMEEQEDWPINKRRVAYILRNTLSHYVESLQTDKYKEKAFKYKLKDWVDPEEMNCYGVKGTARKDLRS